MIHSAVLLYNITSGYKVTSGLGFAQRPDVLLMTENALIFWSVLYYFESTGRRCASMDNYYDTITPHLSSSLYLINPF